MPRLHVTEITSVGLVDAGDNPEAEILFFKRNAGSVPTTKEQPMADDLKVDEVEKTEPATEVAETAPVEVDATQEIIAKLRDENKATAEALASEIRKRREVEAISKAREAGWDELGKADDLGPAMARAEAHEATAEDIGLLTRTLTAAAQAIELGAVFIEKGSTEGADDDPIAQRDAFVKAHPELSMVKARAQFWAENPELVEKARQH